MTTLTVYMKPGCHLCRDAADLLRRLGPEFGFDFREVDITTDPRLLEEYGELIPVVELDGRPLLAAPFGEASARKILPRALREVRSTRFGAEGGGVAVPRGDPEHPSR